MRQPGTFERVYVAIKERLLSGVYRAGQRLEPGALSDELNASATPIRDALHRLTGEGLVEAPRHEGFRVSMMNEMRLRQLYAWHLDLLLLALMKQRAGALADSVLNAGTPDLPAHERLSALFRELAKASGNPEHAAALAAVTEKLAAVQRVEDALLAQTLSQTNAIVDAIEARDRKALRRSLVRYFRKRQQVVPELLAKLLQLEA